MNPSSAYFASAAKVESSEHGFPWFRKNKSVKWRPSRVGEDFEHGTMQPPGKLAVRTSSDSIGCLVRLFDTAMLTCG